MLMILIHVVIVVAALSGAVFLMKFRRRLTDQNTNLHEHWIGKYPSFYSYMKLSIPIIVLGFVLITLAAALEVLSLLVSG
jgi:heme/copper-type cytochrome/quinol oxidase subunit 2